MSRNLPRKPKNKVSEEPRQNQGRGLVEQKLVEAPPPPPSSSFIADRPKAALLFGFLVILDVLCRYISLFFLNIEIGKKKRC